VTVLFVLAHVLNWFLFLDKSFFSCSSHVTKILQNWGNYADMSQAVAIYTPINIDVLLICWLGTQLTQHVRDNYLFYSIDLTYIMQSSLKKLGNQTRIEQSVFFSIIWPTEVSCFARL